MAGYLFITAVCIFAGLGLYSAHLMNQDFIDLRDHCGNSICNGRAEEGHFFCSYCED